MPTETPNPFEGLTDAQKAAYSEESAAQPGESSTDHAMRSRLLAAEYKALASEARGEIPVGTTSAKAAAQAGSGLAAIINDAKTALEKKVEEFVEDHSQVIFDFEKRLEAIEVKIGITPPTQPPAADPATPPNARL